MTEYHIAREQHFSISTKGVWKPAFALSIYIFYLVSAFLPREIGAIFSASGYLKLEWYNVDWTLLVGALLSFILLPFLKTIITKYDARILLFFSVSLEMVFSCLYFNSQFSMIKSCAEIICYTNLFIGIWGLCPILMTKTGVSCKALALGAFLSISSLALGLAMFLRLLVDGSDLVLSGFLWLMTSIMIFLLFPELEMKNGRALTRPKPMQNKKQTVLVYLFTFCFIIVSIYGMSLGSLSRDLWYDHRVLGTIDAYFWIGRILLPFLIGLWIERKGLWQSALNLLLLGATAIYLIILGINDVYPYIIGSTAIGCFSVLPTMLILLLTYNLYGNSWFISSYLNMARFIPLAYGAMLVFWQDMPQNSLEHQAWFFLIYLCIGLCLLSIYNAYKQRLTLISASKLRLPSSISVLK